MKMTKKKVFVTALALSLVAIISMGTLAWFNANDDITNKFLVADSDGDGTPDFKVDVWETDILTGNKTQDGNVYEDIAPGDVLKKNPTVTNMGDYDQWIRVYVTIDNWTAFKTACRNNNLPEDLRTWLNVDAAVWTAADAETTYANDAVTYVYYLNNKLEPGKDANVFTTFSIPGVLDQFDMKFDGSAFALNVKAEALQAEHTGINAQAAFADCWGK